MPIKMEQLILSSRDVEAIKVSIARVADLADEALDQKANLTTGDSWHDESFGRASIEEGIHRSTIRGLQELLKRAIIINPDPTNSYEVNLDSGVLIKLEDGKEEYCHVVGIALGGHNLPEGWKMVSTRAPLGQALIGSHYNETKECNGRRFRILDILSPNDVTAAIKQSQPKMGKEETPEHDG
ncbi:MAG: hypothetical protein ABIJ72_01640 [bacterium]